MSITSSAWGWDDEVIDTIFSSSFTSLSHLHLQHFKENILENWGRENKEIQRRKFHTGENSLNPIENEEFRDEIPFKIEVKHSNEKIQGIGEEKMMKLEK